MAPKSKTKPKSSKAPPKGQDKKDPKKTDKPGPDATNYRAIITKAQLNKELKKKSLWPGLEATKKRAFLSAFCILGNPTQSAGVAAISYRQFRRWMTAEDAQGDLFREYHDEAFDCYCSELESEARSRAIEGVMEPVHQMGRLVGFKRKVSDTLLIFLMKGAMPDKYKDRLHQELTGLHGGPIKSQTATDADLLDRVEGMFSGQTTFAEETNATGTGRPSGVRRSDANTKKSRQNGSG